MCHSVCCSRVGASSVLGANTWPRHAKRCIIELILAWAVESGSHVVPTWHLLFITLEWVQITSLSFIGKEVILEGHSSSYVLSGSLSHSRSTINLHMSSSLRSPTIRVHIAVIVSSLRVSLVLGKVVGRSGANAINIVRILLAHSYQVLHFQSTV